MGPERLGLLLLHSITVEMAMGALEVQMHDIIISFIFAASSFAQSRISLVFLSSLNLHTQLNRCDFEFRVTT